MSGDQFSEAFTAVSPNQKIPGLVHGSVRMMESCAILQYLGEQYPSPLYPTGAARYDVLQWLTWQAACLGPTFGNKLSYTRYMADIPEEQKVHPLNRFNTEAQRLLRVLDTQLQGKAYVCGDDLTIADIAIFPWIRGVEQDRYHASSQCACLERTGSQPCWRHAWSSLRCEVTKSISGARKPRSATPGGSFMASNATIAGKQTS